MGTWSLGTLIVNQFSETRYRKSAEHRSPGLTPVTWPPYIYLPVDHDLVQVSKFKKMEIVAKILNFNKKMLFGRNMTFFGPFSKFLKSDRSSTVFWSKKSDMKQEYFE